MNVSRETLPNMPSEIQHGKKSCKVLLVRMSSMGDLIHTLPAVEDLMKAHPQVELHWLAESSFADIARLHPFVKKVHEVKWRYWRKHLFQQDIRIAIKQIIEVLRAEKFDWILDSQGLLKSAFFAKIAQAPIYGFDWQSAREPLASLFYQKKFNVSKNNDAVWRNRQLFAKSFCYQFDEKISFGLKVADTAALPNMPKRYHVALHATSKDSKLWLPDYWKKWFALMHAYDGLDIWLPWGNPIEKQRAEKLAEGLNYVHLCPSLNLQQAAWLLKHAESIVGVDTGLLHLANALEKPVVGIYTDTDPAKTGVQTSAWAKNLGNVGIQPLPEEVYQTVLACIKAQDAVKISN